MKRFFAVVLALMLALGMIGAMAEVDTNTDHASVTLTMKYSAPNGGSSPAETFRFTALSQVEITENPDADWPDTLPTISDISYTKGAATGTGATVTATIALPNYTAVGVYKYKFNTVTPETKTAGVTYPIASTDRYLVVTVVNGDNNVLRVAAVHCEGSAEKGTYGTSLKTDVIEATYKNGSLKVSKEVTGNLGDKTKKFDVTVTFIAPAGTEIGSEIAYVGNSDSDYTTSAVVSNNTVTLQIKNGDAVTFSNIPAGVSYTVVEGDYTTAANGGYDAAKYSLNGAAAKIDSVNSSIAAGNTDTVTITNNKQSSIDTGITLDSLPYIVLLAAVAVGAALMIARRRRNED